jgi:hypothetical protein
MLEHSGQVVWFHECNCDVRWIWYYWTCGSQEGNIYNCSRLRHRTHLHVSPTWLLDCMGSTPLFPIRELGDCVWGMVSSPPLVLLASWLRWAQGIQNFHVHALWSGHPIFGVFPIMNPVLVHEPCACMNPVVVISMHPSHLEPDGSIIGLYRSPSACAQ